MRFNRFFLLVLFVLASLVSCGGGGGGGGGSNSPSNSTPNLADSNVLSVTVNGSLCSTATNYLNKPCVKITICEPGNIGNCQTINDILLDTGSSGLRIFKQVLSVPLQQALPPVTVGEDSDSLAECVQYGDGSATWGPVQTAGLILGGEPAIELRIQVIDAGFREKGKCSGLESPDEARFNGILGIDNFTHDCGSTCLNPTYYSCNALTCSPITAPLDKQVQNPVPLLPLDNNGFYVQFPSVPSGGASSVYGYLVLGIGTSTNNIPSAAATYPVDRDGEFVTLFNSVGYHAFADTGSNGLFFGFPPSSLPDCDALNDAWFCPIKSTERFHIERFSATNQGAGGSPSHAVSFEIGNVIDLALTGNNVFRNIGGDVGLYMFDWGLPFFLGRTVYFGIDGKSSSLGAGPYIAY